MQLSPLAEPPGAGHKSGVISMRVLCGQTGLSLLPSIMKRDLSLQSDWPRVDPSERPYKLSHSRSLMPAIPFYYLHNRADHTHRTGMNTYLEKCLGRRYPNPDRDRQLGHAPQSPH